MRQRRLLLRRLVFWAAMQLNAAVAGAQYAAPRKQLVEDLRIDGHFENFSTISHLAVGPRGIIAVASEKDLVIRLYDSTGTKIGSIGREGAGPGEFRRIQRIGWVADTLWAYDFSLRRLTLISSAATFIRNVRLSPKMNPPMAERGSLPVGATVSFHAAGVAPGGRMIGPSFRIEPLAPDGQMRTKVYFVAVNADGSMRKVLGVPPPLMSSAVSYQAEGRGSFGWQIPFRSYSSPDYAPDGSRFATLQTVVGDRSVIQTVRVIRATGDTLFSRDYVATGPLIPTVVRDSAINAVYGRSLLPPGVAEKLVDMLRAVTPRIYPPANSVMLGSNNTTWLTMLPKAEGNEVVALDAKGKPIVSVVLPLLSRLMSASLKQVWALEVDNDGIPSVVRYRLK